MSVYLDKNTIPKDVIYEEMVFKNDFEIVFDSKPYKFKKDVKYFIEKDFSMFLRYNKKYDETYKTQIQKSDKKDNIDKSNKKEVNK